MLPYPALPCPAALLRCVLPCVPAAPKQHAGSRAETLQTDLSIAQYRTHRTAPHRTAQHRTACDMRGRRGEGGQVLRRRARALSQGCVSAANLTALPQGCRRLT